jgi:hypothetical protein
MIRNTIARLLLAVMILLLACSPVQAGEKAKEAAKAAENAVVHSFASEDEMKAFVGLFNAKEANINRIVVLEGYLMGELRNADQADGQLLLKYNIRPDRNYSFDKERKSLVEEPAATEKDGKKAKDAKAAKKPVAHTFKSDEEFRGFARLKQARDAITNRINVMKVYHKAEKKNLDKLNAQLSEKYHVEADKKYTLDPENKVLVVAAKKKEEAKGAAARSK